MENKTQNFKEIQTCSRTTLGYLLSVRKDSFPDRKYSNTSTFLGTGGLKESLRNTGEVDLSLNHLESLKIAFKFSLTHIDLLLGSLPYNLSLLKKNFLKKWKMSNI